MKYFQSLPNILQPDFNGNYVTVTNLMARAYLLTNLQNNIYLYYDYDVKDYDKPESIAYKYYNDQYRYWMILYANGIIDPQSEWPLTANNLYNYLEDKYSEAANTANTTVLQYTKSTVHHYEKIITTSNNVDLKNATITIQIDEPTYNSTNSSITTSTLPDNTIITRQIEKNIVYIYDYEVEQNENKRRIKLIKDIHANDMDKQLSSLMSK